MPSCVALVVVAIVVQAALAATGARPAHAASYFVQSLADNTTADGLCTLREAMFAANNTAAHADCGPGSSGISDQIFIGIPGTIMLRDPLPTITQDVHIIGHGSAGNTLDGYVYVRVRAFVINPSIEVILEKLTITNTSAPGGRLAGPFFYGGNGEDGGAIHNRGYLRLVDVRVTRSRAGQGGATCSGCLAPGRGGRGGAIYNAGTLVGYRVTFDGNSAGLGGQYVPGSFGSGGDGGAIYNEVGASVELFAATFTGNAQGLSSRDSEGAALYNDGSAIIRSSTLLGNGLPGVNTTAAIVTGKGTVTLSTTIIADAPGCRNDPHASPQGAFIDRGFNLSLQGSGCGFSPGFGSIPDWSGPVLQTELRNNGGYVPTLALLPTSPAVDQVPYLFEDCVIGITFGVTDARGIARPQNGLCDMGAYELGPSLRRSPRTLAITGAGSGSGTVTGGGLHCAIAAGAGSGQCSGEYSAGSVITATAIAAADSIFVRWGGDPECADGSILMDRDRSCTAIFDLRALSLNGSTNLVGKAHPPKKQGSVDVKFNAEFAFAGAIDLATATVTINALLSEESGAGELVQGVPIVLRARPGGASMAAIFETPSRVAPKVTVEVLIAQPSLSTVALSIEGATLARFPELCAAGTRPSTMLTTSFTIDDGVNQPLTVTSREPWRCQAPTAGDRLQPRLLKTK